MEISTVIIAQNEANRLERCVRSCLPFSAEVLIVDGGSTDATRQVAESLGCRVIDNPWPGYAAQRNLGAREAMFDWIFSVDPDETVDEELRRALGSLRETGRPSASAYGVRRVNSFMGKWFAARPEKKVRLYDRRQATFTESVVHEVVNLPVADATLLPGHVWHDSHGDLEDATTRLNRYTSLEADAAVEQRGFSVWRLLLRPVFRFGHRYVLERSFRQGWRGLFLSFNWAYWELLREMKVYERSQAKRQRQ